MPLPTTWFPPLVFSPPLSPNTVAFMCRAVGPCPLENGQPTMSHTHHWRNLTHPSGHPLSIALQWLEAHGLLPPPYIEWLGLVHAFYRQPRVRWVLLALPCPEDTISQQSSPTSVSQHLSVPSSTMSPNAFLIQVPLVLYTLTSACLCTTHHPRHKTAS